MIVEGRAADGSDDAKLLVEDQLTFAAHHSGTPAAHCDTSQNVTLGIVAAHPHVFVERRC